MTPGLPHLTVLEPALSPRSAKCNAAFRSSGTCKQGMLQDALPPTRRVYQSTHGGHAFLAEAGPAPGDSAWPPAMAASTHAIQNSAET